MHPVIEIYKQLSELLQCVYSNKNQKQYGIDFHTLPSLWGPQVMHPMQH